MFGVLNYVKHFDVIGVAVCPPANSLLLLAFSFVYVTKFE